MIYRRTRLMGGCEGKRGAGGVCPAPITSYALDRMRGCRVIQRRGAPIDVHL